MHKRKQVESLPTIILFLFMKISSRMATITSRVREKSSKNISTTSSNNVSQNNLRSVLRLKWGIVRDSMGFR